MKFSLLIIMTMFLGNCFHEASSPIADDEMIEYRMQPNQFAIVVVLDNQVSPALAKRAARHRAAEIAVSKGFRYFLIQSETMIQVIKQMACLEKDQQEMLIFGDFEVAQKPALSKEMVYPALRVVFQCYETKPKGKSIKACNWTDCSHSN